MNSKKVLTLLLAVIIGTSIYAQKTDIGNWFIYFGNQQVN
jgi:hypothetical protein